MDDDDDPFCLDFTKAASKPAPKPTQQATAPDAKGLGLELVPLEAAPAATEAAPPAAQPAPPPEKPAALKALEGIALLHARGDTAGAATQLEAALRSGKLGTYAEQAWGMMFDVLQILNRHKAFDTLAEAYVKRFEKSPPAWIEPTADNAGLETGGAAFVALSGTLCQASAPALEKLQKIAETNPTVRLGLTKVSDADNDGCRLLLATLHTFKTLGRECVISGAEEFVTVLASKVEMMRREREETWLLLLDLYQQIGLHNEFEDMAVGYAVTFEVSPPSWEVPVAAAKSAPPVAPKKAKDAMVLEGEVLAGMSTISTLAAAATGRDNITIEADHLNRIDESSTQALLTTLKSLHAKGVHIRIRGINMLIATLMHLFELDKIATLETRRR